MYVEVCLNEQQNANADLLAVGAVYDRAVFAVEWDERAVIDRAYSRKWAANFLLCKAISYGYGVRKVEVLGGKDSQGV
jgi:hypothetical protein